MKFEKNILLCFIVLLITLSACNNKEVASENISKEIVTNDNSKNEIETTNNDQNNEGKMEKNIRYARNDAIIQTTDKNLATRVLENGTKVNIYFNDILVPATFNDSKAAKALIEKLPYTVKVNRYNFDVCGVMNDPLPYDEKDEHHGWLNGDVDFAIDGNWFTILFDNEEGSDSYDYQVNIGKVDCDLSVLRNLKGAYDVRIELAENNNVNANNDVDVLDKKN